MERTVGHTRLELVQGDITTQSTDAIVNAANRSLLGGGGVDGAIHRAGGRAILDECKKLGGCKTGDAVITTGGNLPARHVIHTVGPVWGGGHRREAELLASCYRRSLQVADEKSLQSVAFPSISTGAYRYPVEEAARVALSSVSEYLRGKTGIELVRFVLFDTGTKVTYELALSDLPAE